MMGTILAFGASALDNKYVQYGFMVAGVLLALWVWGNSRYNEGVDDTDAKWEEAARILQDEADAAALAATAEKEIRDAEFAEGQADIQEEVDANKTDDLAGAGVSTFFDRLRDTKDGTGDTTTP